jgi:hypothetical protein
MSSYTFFLSLSHTITMMTLAVRISTKFETLVAIQKLLTIILA